LYQVLAADAALIVMDPVLADKTNPARAVSWWRLASMAELGFAREARLGRMGSLAASTALELYGILLGGLPM